MEAFEANKRLLVAGLLLLVVSFFLDSAVSDLVFPLFLVSMAELLSALWFVGLLLIVIDVAAHVQIVHSFVVLVITYFVSYSVKFLTMRPRPGVELFFPLLALPDYAFPSGHTAIVFAIIPLLKSSHFRKSWIIIAVLIGLSRVVIGEHFLSDVVAGAIIGYGTSFALVTLYEHR